MEQNLEALFKGVSFFEDLTPDAMALVLERLIHRTVPAGTMLFRKGEEARGVYILTQGRVEIYRVTAEGREQVIHTETPVQSVAELPVFDGGTYPASGRTAEECELFFLSMDDFQRLYRGHPEIADAVIRNLGRRLRTLVTVVEKVSLSSVPSRVAKALLERAASLGVAVNGGTFELPGTQSDLAHELATSRESVARALGNLRREGIISTEGRQITIHSMGALKEVALKES